MPLNPDLFVHVSLPSGVYRVPRAVAERAGWDALPDLDPPRTAAHKPRVDLVAVTPNPDAETTSADSEEMEE